MTPGFIRTAAFAVIAALSSWPSRRGHSPRTKWATPAIFARPRTTSATGPSRPICGSFTDASDADVYRICLSDGDSFSASTVGATTPTTLDTQLFLFDSQGYGVYANDDARGHSRIHAAGAAPFLAQRRRRILPRDQLVQPRPAELSGRDLPGQLQPDATRTASCSRTGSVGARPLADGRAAPPAAPGSTGSR